MLAVVPVFDGDQQNAKDLVTYASSLLDWAAHAKLDNERNIEQRRYTADCLNDLRKRGLIN